MTFVILKELQKICVNRETIFKDMIEDLESEILMSSSKAVRLTSFVESALSKHRETEKWRRSLWEICQLKMYGVLL